MLPPFSSLLKLSKIFLLNSSESPTRTNKCLFVLSMCLTTIFITVSAFRLWSSEDSGTIKKAVSSLHFFCYVAIFLANIASNWFNSKKYNIALIRIAIFDHYLKSLGFAIDHGKTQRVFRVSLLVSFGTFLCVIVTDCVVDIVLTKSVLVTYWLSIYIPITLNFFSVFIDVFTLFLLKGRYKTLTVYLEKLLLSKSSVNIKQFTNFYLELVKIFNLVVSIFAPQILTLFLFVFTTVTSNTYLMFKIDFSFSQRVIIFNFIALQCCQIVAVVLAHFWTKNEAEKIVTNSPKILTVQKPKTTFDETLECYFLIQDNKCSVKVFDMFSVDPATLLSVLAHVVSYIIILIQFTNGKYNEFKNPTDEDFQETIIRGASKF